MITITVIWLTIFSMFTGVAAHKSKKKDEEFWVLMGMSLWHIILAQGLWIKYL